MSPSPLCEAPDCGKYAVIYDARKDWNLCAEHTHDRMAYLSNEGHLPPRMDDGRPVR